LLNAYIAHTTTVLLSNGPWSRQKSSFGGYSLGGLFQGRSPRRGPGDEVFQKLKQYADIVYRFWLQKRSKLENFIRFIPYSWPATVTVGRLSDPLGAKPLAHVAFTVNGSRCNC